MRTKTLILAVAISAVSLATSLADTNVYSANIVGYVNYANPTGYRMIANPLNSTNNECFNLFANPPGGLTVFKRNDAGNGYDASSYDPDNIGAGGFGNVHGWSDSLTLAPGEGAFILNPAGNYTNTFVGEVKLSSTNVVPTGYSIRGSVVPQSGGLVSVLGFPTPANGTTVYFFNGANYAGGTYQYDDENVPAGNHWSGPSGSGSPSDEPQPAVGQGFWILNPGASQNWVRDFTVN